jgi:hypothetical protein
MLGDFATHSSADPSLRMTPEGGAVQQAADEFRPQHQPTPDLSPDQLAALLEIHRAVAGHLDRKALFPRRSRMCSESSTGQPLGLLLPCTDRRR